MTKAMPWLRMGAFCFALFGLSAMGVLLQQGRLLGGGKGPDGGPAKESTATASLPLDGRGAGKPATRAATGTEEAKRAGALAAGRALFDLPQPISIAEASDLMNDLRRQRADQETRKAALDQREKELQAMEREIEARRTEVLGLAEKLQLNAPSAETGGTGEEYDPAAISRLAALVSSMEAQAAANWLTGTAPEKAALILMRMDLIKAGVVMSLITDDKLARLTECLLRAKAAEEEGEE